MNDVLSIGNSIYKVALNQMIIDHFAIITQYEMMMNK